MYNLPNYDKHDTDLIIEQLKVSHFHRYRAQILTLEEEEHVSLDGLGFGGQVTVDASKLEGRTLTMSVLDPEKTLRIGGDANYTNKMISVQQEIPVIALDRSVLFPIFMGPLIAAPRQGNVVQITARGKMRLACHGIKEPYTVKKGMRKTDAIRQIMKDLTGEIDERMDIPDLPAVLHHGFVIHRTELPAWHCNHIAASLSRNLYYNAAGILKAPSMDNRDVEFTFARTGPHGGWMLDLPEVSIDTSTVKNAVAVWGADITQGPLATAVAKKGQFSPERLGRNGTGAYYWHDVTNTQVDADEAQKLADATLATDLIVNQNVKFDTLIMPLLDEGDTIRVQGAGNSQADLFSFPIVPGDSGSVMSVGWDRRVSTNRFARV